jgi:hypothetical protein
MRVRWRFSYRYETKEALLVAWRIASDGKRMLHIAVGNRVSRLLDRVSPGHARLGMPLRTTATSNGAPGLSAPSWFACKLPYGSLLFPPQPSNSM